MGAATRQAIKEAEKTLNEEPKPSGPDQQFIIQALMDENHALNDNKIYLLAVIKQINAEYEQAKAAWEAERESLVKRDAP